MTRRILFADAVLCVIFAGRALAADISGNWSGTMQMGDNPIPLTYAFKQDGEKLTGTVTSPQGEPLPLSEGKDCRATRSRFLCRRTWAALPPSSVSEGQSSKGEENHASTTKAGAAGRDMRASA